MTTNAGEKTPTESVQAAAMEEEVPTLTESLRLRRYLSL